MSKETVLQLALALSPDDRIELIDELLESVGGWDDMPDLTPEQIAELDRRSDAYRANPGSAMTWDQAEKIITSTE